MRTLRTWWPPLALLALAVAVWEGVVRVRHVPDYLFPAPTSVASSLHADAHLLGSATLVTVREIVLGYLLALAGGLAIAVLLHFSSALRRAPERSAISPKKLPASRRILRVPIETSALPEEMK